MAADEALDLGHAHHLVLGDGVEAIIQRGRVDHHHIGATADLEVPGVDGEVVGDLTGEAVHGLLGRHEVAALGLGPHLEAQQVEREVVVRHVPQRGAGIGEAEEHGRVGHHPLQLPQALVADDGVPAQVVALLLLEVEEAVEGVDGALVGHGLERLAHQ